MSKSLILGGVKSGKSRLAEQWAEASGLEVVYIATATVGDDEMRKRIEAHRVRRPGHWRLVEEPLDLSAVLLREADAGRCLLVDCLTLWLCNLLCTEGEHRMASAIEALPRLISELPGHMILVANETGLGIVPDNRLARHFLDLAGPLHQNLARVCDRVVMTVAGLPLVLKGA